MFIKKLQAIYQVFLRGLVFDPHTLFLYVIHHCIPTKPCEIMEYSSTEVISNIQHGRSLIRFGDGEAMLMTGRDIYYQKTSRLLRNYLRAIASSYTNDSPYILGLPTKELRATETALKKQRGNQVRIWRLFRVLFLTRFKMGINYAYAAMFFEKGWFEKHITPQLLQRHVIVVSNASVLNQALKNYFIANTAKADFVTSPAQCAFQEKEKLLKQIYTLCGTSAFTPIILLAAGPTSKILAYELSLAGIQALDIGHGMESIASDKSRTDKMLTLQ